MSYPNLWFGEGMLTAVWQRFLNLYPTAQFKNCALGIFTVFKTV